jgi:NifU-like protein involved in Fe-S cluster formation
MALYTPEMLALATRLAAYPLDDSLPLRAAARSRTCGSVIELGVACDDQECITAIGMKLAACAIGQASAAIMATAIAGRPAPEIVAAHHQLEEWLAGRSALPDWPGLQVIAPALPHKGRHGALLLPWTAAREALCSADAKR